MLAGEARRFRNESVGYAGPRGLKRLGMWIAQRAVAAGWAIRWPPDRPSHSPSTEQRTLAEMYLDEKEHPPRGGCRPVVSDRRLTPPTCLS